MEAQGDDRVDRGEALMGDSVDQPRLQAFLHQPHAQRQLFGESLDADLQMTAGTILEDSQVQLHYLVRLIRSALRAS